jgi:SNF2 family DNA or RNA helicase
MYQTSSLKSEAPDRNKLRVSYDEKSGRLIIAGPPWLVEHCRSIPNRRWDPKRKIWTAPCIRINAEHMIQRMSAAVATFDEAAVRAMAGCVERVKTARTLGSGFPFHAYRFQTEPRVKQREALSHSYGKHAFALFMDMRTGKTKVVIDDFSALHSEGRCHAVLVICPLTVRKEWQRQWALHSPVKHTVHLPDTDKIKQYEEWLTQKDAGLKVLVVGVESLSAGRMKGICEHFLLHTANPGCVVDEAHNIKNHRANRTEECIRFGRIAKWRMTLTGTPIAKGPMDLFAIFEFLDPDIIGIGDFYSFRNRYAVMGGYEDKEIIGYQHLDELFEIIGPFVYQVRQKEAIDTPDTQYQVRYVKPTKEQEAIYKAISKDRTYTSAAGSLDINGILGVVLRQQQVTGGFVAHQVDDPRKIRYECTPIGSRNPKVEEVMEIAEEVEGAIVVWSRFKPEIDAVCATLRAKYGQDQVVELHGDIDEDARLTNRQKFNEGKARFMVANQSTGGVGVELSAADFMIYFSNTHSFIDRSQSESRPVYDGRKKPIMCIDLAMEGTVDEDVIESINQKMSLSEYVRGKIKESGLEWLKRIATVRTT